MPNAILNTVTVAAFLVLSSTAPAGEDLEMPVAQTPYGAVRGYTLNQTNVWRGIPYAAPPLGDLRFRPPQAPSKWDTVLDTLDFQASCLQLGSSSMAAIGRWWAPAWQTLNLSNSSEDCLYLNVYVPSNASSLLPVMVYLHAGEFRFGASNDQESNWPYFAGGHVLLVTANVRLGLFGFAALEALRSRSSDGSTGNYGMQDQREVLRWVRSCIASFGGDPSRVTIFGESSGGASVAFHLVSDKSRGLFSKVIVQSPGLTQSKTWNAAESNTQYAVSALTAAGSENCVPFPLTSGASNASGWRRYAGLVAGGQPIANATSVTEAIQLCEARPDCYLISVGRTNGSVELFNVTFKGPAHGPGKVLQAVGMSNRTMKLGTDAGFEVLVRSADHASKAALVECLLKARPEDLVSLNIAPPFDDTFQTDAAAPTEDGVELAAPLAVLAGSSAPEGVDVLGGSNLDEGTMFMDECPDINCNATEAEFEAWAVKQFGDELGPKVPPLYQDVEQPAPLCARRRHAVSTTTAWQAAMRSAGDNAILCRTRELLQSARDRGNQVWWYYFRATPIFSVNSDDLQYLGAFHGAEVPFVFGDGFELSSEGERNLSRSMGCYWVNFVTTGNPNEGPSACQSLPPWPALGDDGDAIQFSNTSIETRPALKKAQCDLFAQYKNVPLLQAGALVV